MEFAHLGAEAVALRGWATIPNALTLVRLCLIPVIVREIVAGRHQAAGWWFGAAAFTDTLDGTLARRFRWTSSVGAILDPLADKAMLTAVYLALGWNGSLPVWLVALVLGRDLAILLGAGVLLALGRARRFPPSPWGKASTFCQIMAAVAAMARNAFPEAGLEALAFAAIWPAAAMTVWSGLDYARRALTKPDVG